MDGDAQPVIELVGLAKVFGAGETRVDALRGIDLRIDPGEFVAIMGPSGSGKSTLLHVIGALETPTSGIVRLDGQDLAGVDDERLSLLRRRRIGFVFQAFNLISVLTAEENVALPLAIDGIDEASAQQRAVAALEQVGITGRKSHLPAQLSGGEQQRVAIARAMVTRPRVLLADEPTGNLDRTTGDQIVRLLRRFADEYHQTTLMVTHDSHYAQVADRMILLRDGRIDDDGNRASESCEAPP